MCVYVSVYLCVCVCVYVCVRVCVCLCVRRCVRRRLYIYVHCMCLYDVWMMIVCVRVSVCLSVCIYVCVYLCLCVFFQGLFVRRPSVPVFIIPFVPCVGPFVYPSVRLDNRLFSHIQNCRSVYTLYRQTHPIPEKTTTTTTNSWLRQGIPAKAVDDWFKHDQE